MKGYTMVYHGHYMMNCSIIMRNHDSQKVYISVKYVICSH